MLVGEFEEPIDNIYRIGTIGVLSVDKNKTEKRYFDLQEVEQNHFFVRSSSLLFKNKNLVKNLQEKYKNVSYSVLDKKNEDFILFIQLTKIIQEK
jgi:hypothetical protein